MSKSVHFIDKFGDELAKLEKRNKQLLTALGSAKNLIKIWHNEALNNRGYKYWKNYQNTPIIKRINKAIDGK